MYFLSKDCFVCNAQGYWIILNVNRDKYLCVTHADLASISRRLHGWRDHIGTVEKFPQFGVEADSLIASLMSSGIITRDSNDGKPFAESECPACERATGNLETNAPVTHSVSSITRFFFACVKIDWQLRRKQLSRILARIERRRLRARSSASIHNVPQSSKLMAAFKDLRSLYPRPYLCLFDSLALLEFLASYRSFPRIVFGIVADPFEAHCWLQEGNVLLNDDLERVGKYKAILSV
jgi:hypothetical protein